MKSDNTTLLYIGAGLALYFLLRKPAAPLVPNSPLLTSVTGPAAAVSPWAGAQALLTDGMSGIKTQLVTSAAGYLTGALNDYDPMG
jgi:hypothetical protein